jgi:hypothetical protein
MASANIGSTRSAQRKGPVAISYEALGISGGEEEDLHQQMSKSLSSKRDFRHTASTVAKIGPLLWTTWQVLKTVLREPASSGTPSKQARLFPQHA